MFLTVQDIVLHFWRQLTYTRQIDILETSVCLMFTVKHRTCPSTRCISAANAIDIASDIFGGRSVSVDMTDNLST